MKLLIALTLLSVAFARDTIVLTQPPKGATTSWTPRILRGQDASQGQFPFIVSLNYQGDGHACGASVLNENFVLTAAHCCLTGSPMEIYAGSVKLSSGGEKYPIAQYLIHGDYDPDQHWQNDICIIKMAEPLRLSNDVVKVTLPQQNSDVPSGAQLTAIGWGVDENGNGPDTMKFLTGDGALSNDECKGATGVDVYGGHLCAKAGDGRGVCSGDSGSPLLFNNAQVGIASFVFLPCGSGYPDFFTRVPFYIDWIQFVLGSEASTLNFAQ